MARAFIYLFYLDLLFLIYFIVRPQQIKTIAMIYSAGKDADASSLTPRASELAFSSSKVSFFF